MGGKDAGKGKGASNRAPELKRITIGCGAIPHLRLLTRAQGDELIKSLQQISNQEGGMSWERFKDICRGHLAANLSIAFTELQEKVKEVQRQYPTKQDLDQKAEDWSSNP